MISNIRTAIEDDQALTGKVKPRAEALVFAKNYVSRTTYIPGGFFGDTLSYNWKITEKDLKNVRVPPNEAPRVRAILAEMRASDPGNPLYAETENNINRVWTTIYSEQKKEKTGKGGRP
jgi:hypothetical protein